MKKMLMGEESMKECTRLVESVVASRPSLTGLYTSSSCWLYSISCINCYSTGINLWNLIFVMATPYPLAVVFSILNERVMLP